MSKVFIVEDDDNIRELVSYALKSNSYEVFTFDNSKTFFECINLNNEVDLILLDIMLPNEDGISIIKKLKNNEKTSNIPVIFLTAKTSEYDKVVGLDLGADDYITKPFSILELLSRIKAVLRRTQKKNSEKYKYKNIELILAKRKVLVDNKEIFLTYKEFELLFLLMKNKDIVMDRMKILDIIWDMNFDVESRTVDMHIKSLRKKLGEAGKIIKTIRGIGYKLGD